ncbi:MAG: 3-hydroxy-3-methylglutaryl-CoA reductase, partial [Streptococcus dysgalactiae]|nr:3-hydroxy-3-methylglutaryl-CoA reductase [Streptococcus dysgalactiae]
MTNMNLNWAGFSKKTLEERLQLIKQFELLTPEHLQALEKDYLLPI